MAFSTDRVIMEAGTYPKMWSKGGSEEAVGIDDDNKESMTHGNAGTADWPNSL